MRVWWEGSKDGREVAEGSRARDWGISVKTAKGMGWSRAFCEQWELKRN